MSAGPRFVSTPHCRSFRLVRPAFSHPCATAHQPSAQRPEIPFVRMLLFVSTSLNELDFSHPNPTRLTSHLSRLQSPVFHHGYDRSVTPAKSAWFVFKKAQVFLSAMQSINFKRLNFLLFIKNVLSSFACWKVAP